MNSEDKLEVAISVSNNLRERLERSKDQCKNLEKQIKRNTSSRLEEAQREITHLRQDLFEAIKRQTRAESERDNAWKLMRGMESRLFEMFGAENNADLIKELLVAADLHKENKSKKSRRCSHCSASYVESKDDERKYGTPRPNMCRDCWDLHP